MPSHHYYQSSKHYNTQEGFRPQRRDSIHPRYRHLDVRCLEHSGPVWMRFIGWGTSGHGLPLRHLRLSTVQLPGSLRRRSSRWGTFSPVLQTPTVALDTGG